MKEAGKTPWKMVNIGRDHLERLIYSQDLADIPELMKKIFLETMPSLIAKPRNIDDVIHILRMAGERRTPIIPRGSASSGFGGAIPVRGGIVMDLSLMDKILMMNVERKMVVVEAGVRWWDLERALERVGLALKTYPSSIFSTVGGWASTKGYGLNSLRYGPLKDQIISLEVVTPKGEVKHLEPFHPEFKYHLETEGQMGVITKIGLSVREKPKESISLLIQFSGTEGAVRFIGKIFQGEINPAHIIYMDKHYLETINRFQGERLIQEKDSLLIYLEGEEEMEALLKLLKGEEGKEDLKQAPDYLANYLWHERFFPMKIKGVGPGYLACELLLPVNRITDYLERSRGIASHYGVDIISEAHIVTREEAVVTASFLTDQRKLSYYLHLLLVMLLTEVGVEMGGKPYGVGVWNAFFLRRILSQDQMKNYREYKEKSDPYHILNPGKLFEIKTRYLWIPEGLLRTRLFDYLFKFLTSLSPILGRMILLDGKPRTREEKGVKAPIWIAPYACAKCGSCIPVCPAYLVTGDERVTARGKLLAFKEILERRELAKEEADLLFLCLHCKACDNVCQSELPLAEVWDKLEAELERLYGRPTETISKFVEEVEASEEYKKFVDDHSLLISSKSSRREA